MGNYPWRRMNHKLTNVMKMWKGNGSTTTLLLFSLKGLEILHQERRGQAKTIVMEHFNIILFHKSGPANKQDTNNSINQSIGLRKWKRKHLENFKMWCWRKIGNIKWSEEITTCTRGLHSFTWWLPWQIHFTVLRNEPLLCYNDALVNVT
jgi:hypothetical protein